MTGVRDKTAIVGMGCTAFGDHYNRSVEDLIVEAARGALESAGMSVDDVDAFWVGTTRAGNSGMLLSKALKLRYKPVTRVENYCATGSEALRAACYAVASGACRVAMAVGVEKLKDSPYSGLVPSGVFDDGTAMDTTAPALFSALVPAYQEKFGIDDETMRETMTHIAWKNHRNGSSNPRAQFKKAVAPEVISSSAVVAGKLRIFDCSGMSDGAAAAIVVSADYAEEISSDPIYVKALSLAAGPGGGSTQPDVDLTSFPEVRASAEMAYQEAGITDPAKQLALAEVHDCFTPTELVLMEDLGFSTPGKGWRDVLDGRFDADGELPVNPDGGLKAFGHPVGASGLRMVYEAWLQLRNAAGERQLPGIGRGTSRTLALTHNLGGPPGDCVSFIAVVGSERSE
ncbi:acetyl-CoA acetyltransferase [Nocardia sp. NPDC052278]|uniref:acetyl-CoA acetyltransferase n=1 Tax=unclassified Nocardia TaxID=2637762 RepID=UPI00369C64EE